MSDVATQQTDPAGAPEPALDAIREAMDEAWRHIRVVVQEMGPVLDAGPDAGGWTPRQVLSHIVGAWQRVPIHASFFLAGRREVPIQLSILMQGTKPTETLIAEAPLARSVVARISCVSPSLRTWNSNPMERTTAQLEWKPVL
jgi:hypothetical protein